MPNKTNTFPNGQPLSAYDDDDIPQIDLPGGQNINTPVEPLPESSRPRKDGPGGDSGK